MRSLFLLLAGVSCFLCAAPSVAQQSQDITLEKIWKDGTFNAQRVPGFRFMNDGTHYTRKVGDAIVQYSIVTGDATDTLFDADGIEVAGFNGTFNSYEFSDDESMLLIKSESEQIYRRSSKAYFFIYDREDGEMQPIRSGDKIMHCTFSPDGARVAYVFENNLYVQEVDAATAMQVTYDGEYNHVINGSADWVYEEEFGFTQAYQWSPDGRKVAFMRFNESEVKEFPMEYFNGGMYPELVTFKYPKVDERNAEVTVHIHTLENGSTVMVDRSSAPDGYIPRIKWTNDADMLCVFHMNRHQNHLELLLADATTGDTRTLIEEQNKYYIEITDDLTFLEDGEHFVWTSEADGYNHIYLYDMDGQLVRQLTRGSFDVTSFYGVDEKRRTVVYQAAWKSPLTRQVLSTALDGTKTRTLAGGKETNSAQFSSTYDYYVRTSSTINSAAHYTVVELDGNKDIRVIEDNAAIGELQKQHGTVPVEFFKFNTDDEISLNGWMIKPPDFDEMRQYPVFMYLYGGPGSQQVTDSWKGANYWWFQMLAQQGFIVACVDNRGTGGRGEEFRKMTYTQLGKYETIDQINAAKYLGSLPYTDAARIGIFGWSYGGYMSSLCLLKGNDVFRSAIAVAPVTNWKWYDSIYTERYMRGYAENREGYDQNSPINFADQLRGDYLLVHGLTDDNVHWQHTVEMANALIDANKQFDTYFYPNRNHGISGGNARLHLYTKMTNFIQRSLGSGRGSKGS